MKDNISHITSLLNRLHNIDISRYSDSFLEKSLNSRMVDTKINSLKEYSGYLEQNPAESKIFLDSLNISFSLFFRNSLTFSVLEHIILPELLFQRNQRKRKEIRIWSAACAAGQESYSLAILLEEFNSSGYEKINFRIFATDQSELLVNEAQKGEYSSDEIGNLNLKRIQKWFTRKNDKYIIKEELKANIDFSVFDLFNEQLECPPGSIFGDFDLVICSNLLFYYKREEQILLLNKSSKCITKGGFLISGETERDILLRNKYFEVFPHSAIFRITDNLD